MRKNKTGLDQKRRQQISDRVLILTLMVQLLILVNQSVGLYTTAAQTMQVSMIEPTGENLEIHIKTDTGRPNLIEKLLEPAKDWLNSYIVDGADVTEATTGLTISVTGSNVASTAYIDYYIEAVPQTSGQPYRFLAGNNTAITVGGSSLNPSNQTTIENHLTAMQLDTTQSQGIDYYVYVRATATGTVSGTTLTSEIEYTKFDTVEYLYGDEITTSFSADDTSHVGHFRYPSGMAYYILLGDSSTTYYDYKSWVKIPHVDIPRLGILNAKLQLYADPSLPHRGGFPDITITAEPTASPSMPTTWTELTNKPKTEASQTWTPNSWIDNTYYDSPDLTAIINEVINTPDWEPGDPIQFFLEDTPGYSEKNRICASGSTPSSTHPPKLIVTYIGYSSSWQPLPPLSLASLPITLDLVAMASLTLVTLLLFRENRKKWRNKK